MQIITEANRKQWNYYNAAHLWIRTKFGKPAYCEECQSKDDVKANYQWANKSRLYLRVRDDWRRLCAKCHYKIDIDIHKLRHKARKKYEFEGICFGCNVQFKKHPNHRNRQKFCSRKCFLTSRLK